MNRRLLFYSVGRLLALALEERVALWAERRWRQLSYTSRGRLRGRLSGLPLFNAGIVGTLGHLANIRSP